MSTIGNQHPSLFTLTQLQVLDLHSSQLCYWCGKANIVLEMRVIGPDGNGLYYLLCDYCAHFNSYAEVVASYGAIANEATNPELSSKYNYPWV